MGRGAPKTVRDCSGITKVEWTRRRTTSAVRDNNEVEEQLRLELNARASDRRPQIELLLRIGNPQNSNCAEPSSHEERTTRGNEAQARPDLSLHLGLPDFDNIATFSPAEANNAEGSQGEREAGSEGEQESSGEREGISSCINILDELLAAMNARSRTDGQPRSDGQNLPLPQRELAQEDQNEFFGFSDADMTVLDEILDEADRVGSTDDGPQLQPFVCPPELRDIPMPYPAPSNPNIPTTQRDRH